MKRVTLYPYQRCDYALAENWNVLSADSTLQAVVAQPGSGLVGKTLDDAIGRNASSVVVQGNIEAAMQNSDVLYVPAGSPAGELDTPEYEGVFDVMLSALENGKTVICAAEMKEEQKAVLQTAGDIRFLSAECESEITGYVGGIRMQNLTVPVVFIGSLFGDTDEQAVFFKLAGALRRQGLRVSGVGESVDCQAVGLHTYPEYLIHGGTTDNDRIIRFNLFLSQLEHREKPDVLLIQLPGGLLRFNDAILNGFGIVPYFIAQAASCDYFICCSINDCFNQAFWKSISDDFKYRYGHEIDCVHLSNVSVSMMESMETKHLEYYRTPPEKICLDEQRAQNSRDIPVDDLLDEPAFARLMDDISGKCMLC